MKTAVVGSINMDMTVTAERIPLKERHCGGMMFVIYPVEGSKPSGGYGKTGSTGRDVWMCGR